VAYSPVLASTNPPAGVDFRYGRVSFTVSGLTNGQTVHVTITYPGPVDAYWKYQDATWTLFEGATFSGNSVTLTLTDGGAGDADGVANGTVVDPGAAAVTADSPEPDPEPETPALPATPVGAEPQFTG
jgi:hypothetical protein